jgi:hypothetical protein
MITLNSSKLTGYPSPSSTWAAARPTWTMAVATTTYSSWTAGRGIGECGDTTTLSDGSTR